MRVIHHMTRLSVGLCLAAAPSIVGFAQDIGPAEIIGGPASGPTPFVNAPFSADAITTASHAFPNGARLEQTQTARYFRDSAGRVRIELLMEGLPAPKTLSERHFRLTVFPGTDSRAPAWLGYTLDPITRTVRHAGHSMRPLSAGGRSSNLGVLIGGVRYVNFDRAQDWIGTERAQTIDQDAVQRESLGTKQIAGVETTGERITVTFPLGYFGDNGPVTLVDEQWESRELDLVIYARYTDSRSGSIEYRLTNIRRVDPSPDLFVVPPDYTLQPVAGTPDDPVAASMGPWRYSIEAAAGRLERLLR